MTFNFESFSCCYTCNTVLGHILCEYTCNCTYVVVVNPGKVFNLVIYRSTFLMWWCYNEFTLEMKGQTNNKLYKLNCNPHNAVIVSKHFLRAMTSNKSI